MNHSQRVTSTAYRFGEHRPDTRNTAFRHRGAHETLLIIALGLALLVVAALIWCCLSRTRAKRSGISNRDPEAAVEYEPPCPESAPPFTNTDGQRVPGSGQNSKFSYNQTRSVALPHTVYDPFQQGVSGIGNPQRSEYGDPQPERNRSLSILPSLYRPGDDSSSGLIEQDLQPPPEYSSPPSYPTRTQAYTHLNIDIPTRFLEVSGIDHETTFPGHSVSLDTCLLWKHAERKDFPLSLSQPTIMGTSSDLNRNLFSPETYTANKTISKFTPGTTFFVDHSGRIEIPQLSILPGHATASDSVVTISPCDLISTAGDLSDTESPPGHSEENGFEDSRDAIVTLASAGDGIPQPAGFDEGPTLTKTST